MKWISDLIDIIYPRHCLVCGERLSAGEKDLCANCFYKLPKVARKEYEEIEKSFWGKIEIERAASYIHYHKGSPYNNILHSIKYKEHPEVGERIAHTAAKELQSIGFFSNIDAIVPLPLSKKKRKARGYNQCDYIARGISRATGIPVIKDAVVRSVSNETQTHKNRNERWENVKGIFTLVQAPMLEGRHILLIDDILTTGATLANCAKAIQDGCRCRISIFTLGYTNNNI